MFFSLETTSNDRMPCQWRLGQLILNTDQGWQRLETQHHVLIYKGYADAGLLDKLVADCVDHQISGNFCAFKHDTNSGNISMIANKWRGFLVWYTQKKILTNLYTGDRCLWNTHSATVDQDLCVTESVQDPIGDCETSVIDINTAIDRIHNILTQKINRFVQQNNLPLRVFCSGGIDTALVYSYIKASGADHELVLGSHNEWDHFWCNNSNMLTKKFWAYRQIHQWQMPCIVTSGALGDECMLKNPDTAHLWLMYHGIDMFELLNDAQCRLGSHYSLYASQKFVRLYHARKSDPHARSILKLTPKKFHKHICNIVINDCQHWHIGNTLTYTPLRDLDILQILLRLSPKDALPQMFDSTISKQLIARNDPSLLATVSYKKDTGEELENLSSLIKAQTCVSA